MVTLARELQPSKAERSISVTEFGMVILVRKLQPEKAEPPISVTELGIFILVIELPLNASSAIILVLYVVPKYFTVAYGFTSPLSSTGS